MKVDIDREKCAGHGRCYVFAPDVFEPDDEGYAVAINKTPGERDRDAVLKAQRNCPEQAVIVDETTKSEVA
ncbi:ferredoxin [Sporichthya brevicatena]